MVLNSPVSKAKTEPACAQSLKQIATALNLYVADHDGVFPLRLILGDGGVLASYRLKDKCPSGAIGYAEAFGRAVSKEKSNRTPTLEDPAGRPIPEFDPAKDVLVRCLFHSNDGFNALKGVVWNRSDPESRGKLLGVRFDTSVTKVPVISC